MERDASMPEINDYGDDDDDTLQLIADNIAELATVARSLNLSIRLMSALLRNEFKRRAETLNPDIRNRGSRS